MKSKFIVWVKDRFSSYYTPQECDTAEEMAGRAIKESAKGSEVIMTRRMEVHVVDVVEVPVTVAQESNSEVAA